MVGSRRTAARVVRGAISLSSSNHFALVAYSNRVKPVVLPPGRARLSTKPAPTGSTTVTNTIGGALVACSNDPVAALPVARMTSGASASNSAECRRASSVFLTPQRASIRTLRPSVQPNCSSPWWNAAMRLCPSLSSAAIGMSTPIRRTRSDCCPRATIGHAAAPPRPAMNARRLIRSARRRQ